MLETTRILEEMVLLATLWRGPLGPLEVIMFLHGKSKEFEASLGTRSGEGLWIFGGR